MLRFALSFAVLIACGVICKSQQNIPKSPSTAINKKKEIELYKIDEIVNKHIIQNSNQLNKNTKPVDGIPSPEKKQAEAAKYKYEAWTYEYKKSVYNSQRFASYVIFIISIFIVLVGLYMSWRQFNKSSEVVTNAVAAAVGKLPVNPKIDPAPAPAPAPAPEAQSSIKISPTQIELSTSFIGVIILVLALGYFYLYLRFVYPITESRSNTHESTKQLEDTPK